MHFLMVVNWWEKKECGHDAKEGADKDSVYSSVPLKSVGLNLLIIVAKCEQALTYSFKLMFSQITRGTCTKIIKLHKKDEEIKKENKKKDPYPLKKYYFTTNDRKNFVKCVVPFVPLNLSCW